MPESLFYEDLKPATLLKKSLWHRCFPVNFANFLRTAFLKNTSGQLLLCFKTPKKEKVLAKVKVPMLEINNPYLTYI